jgi:hypothetical protein
MVVIPIETTAIMTSKKQAALYLRFSRFRKKVGKTG